MENYTVRYNMSARKDTVRVKNLTCPYIDREGKAFSCSKTGRDCKETHCNHETAILILYL